MKRDQEWLKVSNGRHVWRKTKDRKSRKKNGQVKPFLITRNHRDNVPKRHQTWQVQQCTTWHEQA
jgi:hypothetical protein